MVKEGLKDRVVSAYPPDKRPWEKAANKRNMSLSKFVCSVVENYLAGDGGSAHIEQLKELDDLRGENLKLRKDLRDKNFLLGQYETENYKLRYSALDVAHRRGFRSVDMELVEVLRRGRTVSSYQIMDELKIDPKDGEAVKLVANQLEIMRLHGIAKETPNGWKWVG